MKWGIRRWQNYDGSLTDAGRIHYGYGPKRHGQQKFGGLFTRKTPQEKAAAAERKTNQKIQSLKNHIQENENAISEKTQSAEIYAKKAEEHKTIADGYQRKSNELYDDIRDLEWSNSHSSKKIEKLEKELEKLRGKKLSDVKTDDTDFDEAVQKVKDSSSDFDGDSARPKRSYDPERSETSLQDYAKQGRTEKAMRSEFDKMRNNATSDEDKDRKVSRWERARDKDLWDIDFMEAVQNSKALHDNDTTTLLREYAKYLDHPNEYLENDEYSRLKPA